MDIINEFDEVYFEIQCILDINIKTECFNDIYIPKLEISIRDVCDDIFELNEKSLISKNNRIIIINDKSSYNDGYIKLKNDKFQKDITNECIILEGYNLKLNIMDDEYIGHKFIKGSVRLIHNLSFFDKIIIKRYTRLYDKYLKILIEKKDKDNKIANDIFNKLDTPIEY